MSRLQAVFYGVLLALAIGWILYIGKGVFVPIIFSILVAYVIVGLARLLVRLPMLGRFVPDGVALLVSAVMISLALAGIAWPVATTMGSVAELAPAYAATLLNLIQEMAAWLGVEAQPTWTTLRQDVLAHVNTHRLIGTTVVSATAILANLVVVFLYVVFLLLEQRAFSAKMARISGDPVRVRHFQTITIHLNERIGKYLALKTILSVLLGLASWGILALFGVEFAAFWGVMIGLLNFVPYLGSVLSVVLPTGFALMQFGEVSGVLAVLACLSIVQFLVGFILDPHLMGSSLNLSPFVILVCLAVWSGLWGIAGAFLAVPVTACMVLVFAEFAGTRPIAVLLSRDGTIERNGTATSE